MADATTPTTPEVTPIWKNPGVLAATISVVSIAAGFIGFRVEAEDQAILLQNVLGAIAIVTSLISVVAHVRSHPTK